MDATLGFRCFDMGHPVASMETAGAIAELDGKVWQFYPERPGAHIKAFDSYSDEHLADLSGTKPAPQAVYGDVAIVLDTLLFDVLEDGVTYRYRVDVPAAQAICAEKTDEETGLVAERTVPDDRLADGMQRSADALDHTVEWLGVISPRSLAGVATAAREMIQPGEAQGAIFECRVCGVHTLNADECPACGARELDRVTNGP